MRVFSFIVKGNPAMSIKASVSLLIYNDDGNRLLSVQRPTDDNELPGAWGLPASSLHTDESLEDAVIRTGQEKLGLVLCPVRRLNTGTLERLNYQLKMTLYEARIEKGTPSLCHGLSTITQYQNWCWAESELLIPAAEKGSLCSRLCLDYFKTITG
jgi:hypothetical protein